MKQVESNNWAAAVLSKGGLPRAARGEGIYIHDTAGKRYIDASGGPADRVRQVLPGCLHFDSRATLSRASRKSRRLIRAGDTIL